MHQQSLQRAHSLAVVLRFENSIERDTARTRFQQRFSASFCFPNNLQFQHPHIITFFVQIYCNSFLWKRLNHEDVPRQQRPRSSASATRAADGIRSTLSPCTALRLYRVTEISCLQHDGYDAVPPTSLPIPYTLYPIPYTLPPTDILSLPLPLHHFGTMIAKKDVSLAKEHRKFDV